MRTLPDCGIFVLPGLWHFGGLGPVRLVWLARHAAIAAAGRGAGFIGAANLPEHRQSGARLSAGVRLPTAAQLSVNRRRSRQRRPIRRQQPATRSRTSTLRWQTGMFMAPCRWQLPRRGNTRAATTNRCGPPTAWPTRCPTGRPAALPGPAAPAAPITARSKAISGPLRGAARRDPHFANPAQCCQWYASTYALVINRNEGRSMWMSYNSNSLPTQGNNTQFGLDSGWGGEVEVGHRFCWNCVPCAVELTYWTTTDLTGSNSASYPGNSVNTLLGTDYITFHLPTGDYPANNWFYGAAEQTLSRQDEFQNLEINLVRDQLACACGSPWDIGWSAGIRYFRFQDKLTYNSFMPGAAAGTTGEASLSDNICNNLVGVQVGFDAAYNFGNGLRLFIKPQVGIYDNILDGNFQCQLGDGTEGYTTPYYNQYYPVHGSRDGVAFLTQIDVGAEWQFSRN